MGQGYIVSSVLAAGEWQGAPHTLQFDPPLTQPPTTPLPVSIAFPSAAATVLCACLPTVI